MIKPLTSLRIFFAVAVLMSHYEIPDQDSPFFYHLFAEGGVGVNCFFILSGFILAHTYRHKMTTLDCKAIKTFYVARFARIYPLHFLCIFLYAFLQRNWETFDTHYIYSFLQHLFLLQSWNLAPMDLLFNRVSWSLSDEAFFYLLFPFAVYFFMRKPKIFLTFLLASMLTLLMLCHTLGQWVHVEWFFWFFPPVRFVDFCWGIALYFLCNRLKDKDYAHKLNFTRFELGAIAIFLAFYCLSYYIPPLYRHSVWMWLPAGCLIAIFFFQQGKISKMLSCRLLVYGGEISFAFYMLHLLGLHFAKKIGLALFHSEQRVAVFTLALLITLFLSHLSFKYLEKPCNSLVKRLFASRNHPQG